VSRTSARQQASSPSTNQTQHRVRLPTFAQSPSVVTAAHVIREWTLNFNQDTVATMHSWTTERQNVNVIAVDDFSSLRHSKCIGTCFSYFTRLSTTTRSGGLPTLSTIIMFYSPYGRTALLQHVLHTAP